MKNFKVIILGCGASGIMCALSTKEKNVAVIDVVTKPAKKLLVTGNGRCNLTNENINSSFYNTNLDGFFDCFSNKDTLDFFEKLGLVCFADEEGRVYPLSNSAKSVVDVLSGKLQQKASVFLGQKIEKIEVGSKNFVIKTDKDEFFAEKLVVATGGNSIEVLEQLGVKFSKFVPSLVALKCDGTRDLCGAKLSNVLVTATNFAGEKKSEIGEVLFKENGLSGIVIFNLSTLFSRRDDFRGKIEIDLLPNLSKNEVCKMLENRKSLAVSVDKFFVGMFQNSVANEIFKQTGINTNKSCQDLSFREIETLAKSIKCLNFVVSGALDNNQVFSGGVRLQDLDQNLMSKKVMNLYFCGEVVDVDGVCGGFNLQWAWTSGHIVGDVIG